MANVEHSTLTGTDLHEPKGIAAAAANRVYLSNGSGSGTWTTVPAAAITAAGVLVFQGQFYHAREERASGANGTSLTDNTWNTRPLTSEVTDDLTLSISSNQIALPAGTYYAEVDAVTYFAGTMERNTSEAIMSKLRIRNVTDSTTLLVGMTARFSLTDDGGGNNEFSNIHLPTTLHGRFTLGGTKTIEIQNWVKNDLTSSGIAKSQTTGLAISSGENEIYLDFRLWKLA